MTVPHGIALSEETDTLCIADRENKQVVCIKAGLAGSKFGQLVTTIQEPNGARVFDVDFIGE